ncbi:MAG TPA: dTDP-4-amino-4,6-dideoxygalactose transaminase [bacterium]|nr:dTDP-4-amino-4,6-dideoxygalactose transaminase [bacterium]
MEAIPFNKPHLTGRELDFIRQAHENGQLAGDGPFTAKCHGWLEENLKSPKALLTHSCTAALEMAALLADLKPGDEVILPSYTFVSTANAFALRGAVPVFVDVRPDTLNLDEAKIEEALTPRTRALVPVHYAGVACEMDPILELARRRGLLVVEDAAQGICAQYRGRPLGSLGHLGALSFHETKNIISGEGGALLVNDPAFADRSEIIREKGTNRKKFFRGQVDKYTWVDLGSSYLPGEIVAAFLWAQMQEARRITAKRLQIWDYYHRAFAHAEKKGLARRPIVPDHCQHNAHLYYLLLPDLQRRTALIAHLKARGIQAVFHYVPLDSSEFGRRCGRAGGSLENTRDLSSRLVRLPLWVDMEIEKEASAVVEAVLDFLK